MWLFPSERAELQSTSTPEEVKTRLAEIVTQGHWAPQRPLRGRIQGRRFKLVRNVARTHAVVRGDIETTGAGCVVRLRFRPPWMLAVLLGVWFTFFSCAVAASVRELASGVAGVLLALAAGTATVWFAAFLLTAPFRRDVRAALETLRAAVERG